MAFGRLKWTAEPSLRQGFCRRFRVAAICAIWLGQCLNWARPGRVREGVDNATDSLWLKFDLDAPMPGMAWDEVRESGELNKSSSGLKSDRFELPAVEMSLKVCYRRELGGGVPSCSAACATLSSRCRRNPRYFAGVLDCAVDTDT